MDLIRLGRPRLYGVGLFVVLAASVAAAQRTWVVDTAGGPGTDFTDLPPALAAAQSGDRILVRAGSYGGGEVQQSLRIVGEPGARIGATAALVVSALPVPATVEISGLGFERFFGPGLIVQHNAGIVTLRDISATAASSTVSLRLVNNRYVALSGQLPPVVAEASGVAINDTTIAPSSYYTTAVTLVGCQAFLAGCDLTGGPGSPSGNPLAGGPGSGIFASAGTVVRLAGTVVSRGGSASGHPYRAAYGLALRDSVAVVDPAAVLIGTNAPGVWMSGSQVTTAPVAGVTVRGGSPGGTLQASLSAPTGVAAVLVVSSSAAPMVTTFGTLLVDPAAAVTLAAGNAGPQGLIGPLLQVPANSSLRGTPLHFQGAALTPLLTLSAPASTVLR